jgi:pyridoxine kinase
MKTVLSIQSHVAYGHVGNAAAVFPLQRMGYEVIAINTVQFSNHTGYGKWTGQVFTPGHIADVLKGLEDRGVLQKVDALLTGYIGDPMIGEVILKTLGRLPKTALWLCDPVMGDVGRGFFVREGIPDFFKNSALPRANIITPNQFELEYLSGYKINHLDDALEACVELHKQGPEHILVTSLIHGETPENSIQMLLSCKDGRQYLTTTPRLPLDPAPNGAGDCTAAVFLGNILAGHDPETALSKTSASILKLFEETMEAGTRELALIQAQDSFSLSL